MTASDPHTIRSGVAFSVIASVLFACMYYQAALLAPLGSAAIYGWRILLTAPFLGALLVMTGRWEDVASIWRRLRARPALWPVLLLSSALLGVQLWLFMWAPINGHGLDVSLGYFLLPLTLVLTGRLCFGERISRLQRVACALAAVGVGNELLFAPQLSWPAFVVALGYPCYFALRRILGTNHLGGMWFDMVLSLPVGLWFVLSPLPAGAAGALRFPVLGIAVLGVLSAVALACMIAASQRLKLGLFGLLSYVEPALLVLVSLLLGERILHSQWLTYGSIWAAILLLMGEGVVALRAVKPLGRPA